MAVWATDSFNGVPAGLVHRNANDSYGRPHEPALGSFYYFANLAFEDVPPSWRCPDCEVGQAG